MGMLSGDFFAGWTMAEVQHHFDFVGWYWRHRKWAASVLTEERDA